MAEVALADVGGWPAVLASLMAGDDLSTTVAGAAMAEILAGDASPAQLAAFVVALRMKGETVEEFTGLVRALLDVAEKVPLDSGTAPVDTCGMGGVQSRRVAAFNVSTIAAFVIAGAGAPVCKHGNRAASSTSGSADLLEALGVSLDLGGAGVARCVAEAGMGFCFAPRFHPAMRHAGPTRRELGVQTVFNVIGPLANPARVRHQVLGVGDPRLAEKLSAVLQANGAERAVVVSGHDGLDELTTTTTSTVHELRDGARRAYEVDPATFGIARAGAADLQGGDVARNVALAEEILGGTRGPHRDLVLLNAAAGLVASGAVDDLADGYEAAAASVDGGQAGAVVTRLVAVSRAITAGGITDP